jgi:hypothetical protein
MHGNGQFFNKNMSFDYPLRTKFIYLLGGRCYLLDYLGKGGYENQECSFHVTDATGYSYLQIHSHEWLVSNIQNNIIIIRTKLPYNLVQQIQEYVTNVKQLHRLDLPDDLKNLVKVYLGNVSYSKLLDRK